MRSFVDARNEWTGEGFAGPRLFDPTIKLLCSYLSWCLTWWTAALVDAWEQHIDLPGIDSGELIEECGGNIASRHKSVTPFCDVGVQ